LASSKFFPTAARFLYEPAPRALDQVQDVGLKFRFGNLPEEQKEAAENGLIVGDCYGHLTEKIAV